MEIRHSGNSHFLLKSLTGLSPVGTCKRQGSPRLPFSQYLTNVTLEISYILRFTRFLTLSDKPFRFVVLSQNDNEFLSVKERTDCLKNLSNIIGFVLKQF